MSSQWTLAHLYPADDDEFETAAEMSLGIGQLSLDENHEVRTRTVPRLDHTLNVLSAGTLPW
jgi:hypothetical protein